MSNGWGCISPLLLCERRALLPNRRLLEWLACLLLCCVVFVCFSSLFSFPSPWWRRGLVFALVLDAVLIAFIRLFFPCPHRCIRCLYTALLRPFVYFCACSPHSAMVLLSYTTYRVDERAHSMVCLLYASLLRVVRTHTQRAATACRLPGSLVVCLGSSSVEHRCLVRHSIIFLSPPGVGVFGDGSAIVFVQFVTSEDGGLSVYSCIFFLFWLLEEGYGGGAFLPPPPYIVGG